MPTRDVLLVDAVTTALKAQIDLISIRNKNGLRERR